MKYFPAGKKPGRGRFLFRITPHEKNLLIATLKFYPLMDPENYRLSKHEGAVPKSDQEWLVETMAEEQKAHQKKLAQFIDKDARFTQNDVGEHFFGVNEEQLEWLLRILNDVRVGAWVKLGCPEMEAARQANFDGAKAHLFSAMELSGYFQTYLLEAFG